MTKSELINKLADHNPNLQHSDLERVVSTILDEITDALQAGERVELRGFGAFSIRERQSRISRNPRTGEAVQVDAKRTPFFKAGKDLRERVNN